MIDQAMRTETLLIRCLCACISRLHRFISHACSGSARSSALFPTGHRDELRFTFRDQLVDQEGPPPGRPVTIAVVSADVFWRPRPAFHAGIAYRVLPSSEPRSGESGMMTVLIVQ